MDGAGKDKSYAMCVTGPHRDAGMRSHSALMTRDSSEQTHDNIGGFAIKNSLAPEGDAHLS